MNFIVPEEQQIITESSIRVQEFESFEDNEVKAKINLKNVSSSVYDRE